jgi:hypothetical protein
MAVVPHQHSPMLRRIRILIDLFRNLLAESGLLGKPLAGKPGDGMPAYLDGALFGVDIGLFRRYDAGPVTQSE